jgi:hypothetical protein
MATSVAKIRMRLEGDVELKYLQDHIRRWEESHPELVKTAMWEGANMLWWETRQKMHEVLQTRTGKLQAALSRTVARMPDGVIDAEVFVSPGAGALQPVKMRALELGSYRQHPGGNPYLMFGGKARWITKKEAEARERQGKYVLYTKGPYGIRVPRYPVFKPTLKKNRTKIAQMILKEIIEGFKREQAQGVGA